MFVMSERTGTTNQEDDMTATQNTETAINFDDVKVGDALTFQVRWTDHLGSSFLPRAGVVVKKTAKTVMTDGGNVLNAKQWYDRNVRLVTEAGA